MGSIEDSLTPRLRGCTRLCTSLLSATTWRTVLPSHDELISRLCFSESDKAQGTLLGSWGDLQSHHHCPFCKLVVAAITQTCSSAEVQRIDLDQPIRIVIFPGEQILRLSYPSRFTVYLAFTTNFPSAVSGPQICQVLPRDGIDPMRIMLWLEDCDTHHRSCATGSQLQSDLVLGLGPSFRVVDLERECVKQGSSDLKYVALSYVWGKVSTFQLRNQNFEELYVPGSLRRIASQIPQTIKDAMKLLSRMRLRYMWVDTLCLIQDDKDDVARGISAMQQIYRGSYFTLVAGSSDNAACGLPSLAPHPRDIKNTHVTEELMPGVRMSILHSIDWHLRQSIYNTRGWTLQEMVLPMRTVIFINDQVYFRCQEANRSEELWPHDRLRWIDPDDSNISRLPPEDAGRIESLWAYQKLCEEYSLRRLQYDGDALRALHGVTDILISQMQSPTVEGLPGYLIDHFILFSSPKGDLKRRPAFASYSWAGWSGQVTWPRENFLRYTNGVASSWEKTQLESYLAFDGFLEWMAEFPRGYSERLTHAKHDMDGSNDDFVPQYLRLEAEKKGLPWARFARMVRRTTSGQSNILQNPDEEEGGRKITPSAHKPKPESLEADQSDTLMESWAYITDPNERRRVQNRLAQRKFRERMRLQVVVKCSPTRILSKRQHRTIGENNTRSEHAESHPYWTFPRTGSPVRDGHDRTGLCNWAKNLDETTSIFPPYAVLETMTIAVYLRYGSRNDDNSDDIQPSRHRQRLPLPLYSSDGKLQGSLQPDNFELLGDTSSIMEFLLISRCHGLTANSALLALPELHPEKVCNVFWALYVECKNGITYRKGVSQLLYSVLAANNEPRWVVKDVVLG